jgi:hypothetical protein
MWRLWSLSLGEKASKHSKEADKVAVIRTIIFATYLITNIFIVAGVIHHWNDVKYQERLK